MYYVCIMYVCMYEFIYVCIMYVLCMYYVCIMYVLCMYYVCMYCMYYVCMYECMCVYVCMHCVCECISLLIISVSRAFSPVVESVWHQFERTEAELSRTIASSVHNRFEVVGVCWKYIGVYSYCCYYCIFAS